MNTTDRKKHELRVALMGKGKYQIESYDHFYIVIGGNGSLASLDLPKILEISEFGMMPLQFLLRMVKIQKENDRWTSALDFAKTLEKLMRPRSGG